MKCSPLSTVLFLRFARGIAFAATASSVSSAEVPAGADNSTALHEVVVTATRRTERLIDIPQAVTAISGEELNVGGIRNFADYGRSVPGLSFSDLGTGRPKPTLRGINVNAGAAAVGYYIDETPIPTSSGSIHLTTVDPRLFDVERIEVLRGPQGTLYGAGSMGGTIRIITRRPNLNKFEGEVRLTADDIDNGGIGGGFDAVLNLPLVDDHVALRASAWKRYEAGFIQRTVNGNPVRDVPEQNTVGGRADLAVEYGIVRVDASVFHEQQRYSGFQNVTFGADNPQGRLVQNFLFDIPEPNRNRFTLANLSVQFDLGFASLLSSSSHYRGGLSATEEGSEFLKAYIGPTVATSELEAFTKTAFTQELRLTSKQPVVGIDYVVGAFYDDQETKRTFDWNSEEYAPILGDSNLFTGRYRNVARQRAIFGELSFHPIRSVTLTAGGRYYSVNGVDNQDSRGALNGGVTIAALGYDVNGKVGKFSASWKPEENAQLYIQAAEGFRPGFGVAQLPTLCEADVEARGLSLNASQVQPDKVWNYEVGAKKASADGRLRGALSAYRIDWSDVQLGVFLPCGFRLFSNAGDARIKGLEFEGAAKLTESIELGGNFSYTQTRYTRVADGASPHVGDPVLEVPKWQGSLYLEKTFPVSGSFTGLARIDAQYAGRSLLFYERDQASAPAPLSFRERPSLTLLNARFQVQNELWTFALFGRNLSNQVKVVGFGDSLSANVAYRPRFAVNQPRTIGVEMSRRF